MKKIKITRERQKGNELTIFIICAFVVVACLFYIFFLQYNFDLQKDEPVGLDINSENVFKLDIEEAKVLLDKYKYPSVLSRGNDSFNTMTYYYSKNKILVSEMSDEAKFLIAVQNSLESYYCNDENTICYLKEELVKDKYEELFDNEYKYVETSNVTKKEDVFKVSIVNTYSNGFVYTKITDALYNDTTLRVYVKVAFQYDTSLYYNYDLTNVIEEISTCQNVDDLDKYDNLNTYVYTFDIKDDLYILKSVEKI